MVTIDTLRELELFRGLSTSVLQPLMDAATIIEPQNNALVVKQHDRAIALFVLLSGHVQFLIEVEGSGNLLVGVGRDPDLIIGWSVFRPPYRYTTNVRCEGSCRLLRIPHHVIDTLVEHDPASALVLLRRVNQSLAGRLEAERTRLLETASAWAPGLQRVPDPIVQTDLPWTAKSL